MDLPAAVQCFVAKVNKDRGVRWDKGNPGVFGIARQVSLSNRATYDQFRFAWNEKCYTQQEVSPLAANRSADDPLLYTTPYCHVKRGTLTQMA